MKMSNIFKGAQNGVNNFGKGTKKLVGTVGVATMLSLSNPAFAESPSFTTYTGEVMTFQELNDIIGTTKWENIVLRMDSEKSKEYELWLDRATASLNADTANLNADTARLNADTTRRQGNIDRMEGNIDRHNEIQTSNRAETQRIRQINAILDLLVEGLNLNTNEQMAKSFESIANDVTLGLTQNEKNVFLQLAESYKNGGNGPLYVSDKAKRVFKSFAQKMQNTLSQEELVNINNALNALSKYL